MEAPTIIGPDDVLERRPFTDPAHTVREVEVMQSMLAEVRRRARAWADEPRTARGKIVRDSDPEGRRHLIVVPDTGLLLAAENATAVGFFGRPRKRVDHGILFTLEEELVARMGHYADLGLLTYYDVEFVKGAYGNLVLFATSDVPPEWYRDEVHRRAVEISPGHYYEVRLHKGTILGPLLGDGAIRVERTKYFDFKRPPSRWQGVRQYSP